jgi:hypothetical protein
MNLRRDGMESVQRIEMNIYGIIELRLGRYLQKWDGKSKARHRVLRLPTVVRMSDSCESSEQYMDTETDTLG